MTDNKKIRCDRLRELRLNKKLSQKQVASKLGITQKGYSNYETGRREFSPEVLIWFASFYKTSTDYILGVTNNRKKR